MAIKTFIFSLILLVCIALGILAQTPAGDYTRVDLTEKSSGRVIFSAMLSEGEPVIFVWRNSLFNLKVTEGFRACNGKLIQHTVIFADPRGLPPPEVRAADVEDLYHTGGSFAARDLNKTISRVIYRVSEVGNPQIKIRDRVVDFKQEVGFGGAVILTASSPKWYEVFLKMLEIG